MEKTTLSALIGTVASLVGATLLARAARKKRESERGEEEGRDEKISDQGSKPGS